MTTSAQSGLGRDATAQTHSSPPGRDVDLGVQAPSMGVVQTNQPLSPVEAFALALTEASSRLTVVVPTSDVATPPATPDDAAATAAAE